MKAGIAFLILGVALCWNTAARAQETYPTDVLFAKLVKAYQAKDIEEFKKYIWYNAPRGSRVMERTKGEFERYDTITLLIRPLSTVFYKRMGYDNVEVRVMEDFSGFDLKENRTQESSTMSVFSMFKDFDGTYYILNWERQGALPMIRIQKAPAAETKTN